MEEETEIEPIPPNPHKCPKCGGEPRGTRTKYGVRYTCCRLWAWGPHPLVDAATHEARKKAHEVFDELWRPRAYIPRKKGRVQASLSTNKLRANAYFRLAEILQVPPAKCHMKQMDYETAIMVPLAVSRIKAEWREKGWWKDD